MKREPGLAGLGVGNSGFKAEPDDWNDVRLSDIPTLSEDNHIDSWLNDLESEDEGSVQQPPPMGREYRAARKSARLKIAEIRTRNAVDRWIRFVRVELGRST